MKKCISVGFNELLNVVRPGVEWECLRRLRTDLSVTIQLLNVDPFEPPTDEDSTVTEYFRNFNFP